MAAAISPVPATVHRRATPTVRSVPRLKPRAPTPAEPVAESASAATLAAESALLGQAQRALSARDPARARSLLEQHADQFPHGDLALDRRAAWARMLCVAGEAEAARELAASLGREHPRVPAVVALRDVCRAP
jgi:hypothetical protein